MSSRRSPTGKPAAGPWALVVAVLLLAWPLAGGARGVYLTAEEFLAQAFGSVAPQPATLWLSDDVKRRAAAILDHPPTQLRVRYWRAGGRTAWILDEIGKTHPITIGVVVERGAVADICVLEFRESRGDEVRLPFFTGQFRGVGLRPDAGRRLDRAIDGITGATLSVRAMERVARLALYFHGQVAPEASGSVSHAGNAE
ncbi:MAG: FMN-binding protein [Porticoccaceae bacterium]